MLFKAMKKGTGPKGDQKGTITALWNKAGAKEKDEPAPSPAAEAQEPESQLPAADQTPAQAAKVAGTVEKAPGAALAALTDTGGRPAPPEGCDVAIAAVPEPSPEPAAIDAAAVAAKPATAQLQAGGDVGQVGLSVALRFVAAARCITARACNRVGTQKPRVMLYFLSEECHIRMCRILLRPQRHLLGRMARPPAQQASRLLLRRSGSAGRRHWRPAGARNSLPACRSCFPWMSMPPRQTRLPLQQALGWSLRRQAARVMMGCKAAVPSMESSRGHVGIAVAGFRGLPCWCCRPLARADVPAPCGGLRCAPQTPSLRLLFPPIDAAGEQVV